MASRGGDRILELVERGFHEDALGIAYDAGRARINRAHIRLLHVHRRDRVVREALNRAKTVLVSETPAARGRRLCDIGRRAEALVHLAEALERDPSAENHHCMARALVGLDRHADALPHLERAVALRGELLDHMWIGRALDRLGRWEDALPHFRKLVEERGSAVDHHWLGAVLYSLRRWQEAIPHLRAAASRGNDRLDQELLDACEQNVGEVDGGLMGRLSLFFSGLLGPGGEGK